MSDEKETTNTSTVDPESINPEWWENLRLGKRIATVVTPEHRRRGDPGSHSYCANMVSYRESYPLVFDGRITGGTINLHVLHRDGSKHSYKLAMDEEAYKVVHENDRTSAEGNYEEFGDVEVYGILMAVTELKGHTYAPRAPRAPKIMQETVKQEPGCVVKTEPVAAPPKQNDDAKQASAPLVSPVIAPSPICAPSPVIPSLDTASQPAAGVVSTSTSTIKPILNVAPLPGQLRTTYMGRTDPRRYRKGRKP